MRRGLPAISLALIVVGLELTSGALSGAYRTVRRVLAAVVAGEPVTVSLPGFFLGLGFLVAGVGGLGAALWSRMARGRLALGKACPECGTRTDRIHRKRRHRLLARITGEEIHRRVCTECGWKGICRIRRH